MSCASDVVWLAVRGVESRPLDREETIGREAILNRSMNVTRARRIEEEPESGKPFYARIQFIEALASLTALYKDEVARKVTGSNKPLYKLLWCAAAAGRIEWYLNNTRLRYTLPPSRHSLLPSGTSSNEALHAEVNNWFRQTQQMHQSTLYLKLNCLSLGKQLAHSAALYSPTTRQFLPNVVLAWVSSRPLWSATEWRRWCGDLSGCGRTLKAALPVYAARRRQADTVRAHVRKRPARPGHDAKHHRVRKRTPFSLRRTGGLITGGVKRASAAMKATLRVKPATGVVKRPAGCRAR